MKICITLTLLILVCSTQNDMVLRLSIFSLNLPLLQCDNFLARSTYFICFLRRKQKFQRIINVNCQKGV